jgi:hypothetical protein
MKLINRAVTSFLTNLPELVGLVPEGNIQYQLNDPFVKNEPVIVFFAENSDKTDPIITQDSIYIEKEHTTQSIIGLNVIGAFPEEGNKVYNIAELLDDENKSSLFRRLSGQTILNITFLDNCFFQKNEPQVLYDFESGNKNIIYNFQIYLSWH